jgi:uncharacterized protein YbjT (DUF2867 family)
MKLLLLGATGRTGKHVLSHALEKGLSRFVFGTKTGTATTSSLPIDF